MFNLKKIIYKKKLDDVLYFMNSFLNDGVDFNRSMQILFESGADKIINYLGLISKINISCLDDKQLIECYLLGKKEKPNNMSDIIRLSKAEYRLEKLDFSSLYYTIGLVKVGAVLVLTGIPYRSGLDVTNNGICNVLNYREIEINALLQSVFMHLNNDVWSVEEKNSFIVKISNMKLFYCDANYKNSCEYVELKELEKNIRFVTSDRIEFEKKQEMEGE